MKLISKLKETSLVQDNIIMGSNAAAAQVQKPWFYAVAKGHRPGIYSSWNETKRVVAGYRGAVYKKFNEYADAESFISNKREMSVPPSPSAPPLGTPENNPEELVVFTDGSAKHNNRKKSLASGKSSAGYACVWPYMPEWNYSSSLSSNQPQTNNRAEYMAVITALHIADKIDPDRNKHMTIFTDSELVINSVTKWMRSWKKNGWVKADGQPVQNLDLIQQIDEYMLQSPRRKIVFKHVRAHTSDKHWEARYNDIADQHAKNAAATG